MRVGIIGSGNIASQMAATINQVDGVELYAVASRTVAKAKDFAEKFGASCYYGNYEDLANDKNVDLVYIATPPCYALREYYVMSETWQSRSLRKTFYTKLFPS